MKNYLHIADERMIEVMQDSYLWLWDRTGVYVGTLFFAFCAADLAFYGNLCWFDFAWLTLMGVIAGIRYVAQTKSLRELNDIQRMWRDIWGRFYIVLFTLLFMAGDVVLVNWMHFVSDTCNLGYLLIGCIQIREREPKEFFPSLKPVGAQT
jgi:hypothetical protein